MDQDKVIAIVSTFAENSNVKYVVTQNVYNLDIYTTKEYFIKWANKLKTNQFQIESTVCNFKVVFNIYNRDITNNQQYIIIVKALLNDLSFERSYKINNSLESIHIEDISDIISFFVRICNGNIVYIKDNSIIQLIDFQMKRIAVEIE